MGVWIETDAAAKAALQATVTPFVGVWIETSLTLLECRYQRSHPSWVCGLKQPCDR